MILTMMKKNYWNLFVKFFKIIPVTINGAKYFLYIFLCRHVHQPG